MAYKSLYHLIQSIVVDTVKGELRPMTVQPGVAGEGAGFKLDQQLDDVPAEALKLYGSGEDVEVTGHLTLKATGGLPGTIEAEVTGTLNVKSPVKAGEPALMLKRAGSNRYYMLGKLEPPEPEDGFAPTPWEEP